jgi:hypothetical protein
MLEYTTIQARAGEREGQITASNTRTSDIPFSDRYSLHQSSNQQHSDNKDSWLVIIPDCTHERNKRTLILQVSDFFSSLKLVWLHVTEEQCLLVPSFFLCSNVLFVIKVRDGVYDLREVKRISDSWVSFLTFLMCGDGTWIAIFVEKCFSNCGPRTGTVSRHLLPLFWEWTREIGPLEHSEGLNDIEHTL